MFILNGGVYYNLFALRKQFPEKNIEIQSDFFISKYKLFTSIIVLSIPKPFSKLKLS